MLWNTRAIIPCSNFRRGRLYQPWPSSCIIPLRPHPRGCTITTMSHRYEANVALMHLAGGAARITPPPGTVAQTAPRRSARGRSDDYLLLNLRLRSARQVTPGHLDHLAKLAVRRVLWRAGDSHFGPARSRSRRKRPSGRYEPTGNWVGQFTGQPPIRRPARGRSIHRTKRHGASDLNPARPGPQIPFRRGFSTPAGDQPRTLCALSPY